MNHLLFFLLSANVIFFGTKYFEKYHKHTPSADNKERAIITPLNNQDNILSKNITTKSKDKITYDYNSPIYLPNNQNCQSLGRHTWALLHSTAANYPTDPSEEDIKLYKDFFYGLLHHYPSHSKLINDFVAKKPLQNSDRNELVYYICEIHNYLNSHLDKDKFNCRKAFDVWGGECGCDD